MRRSGLMIALCLVLALLAPRVAARAQDGVFPLPAPLYILDSQGTLLHIDPASGAQTQVSNPNQPVADFDIAPDGLWFVFRTANEGTVIVGQIGGQSGYVLEFDSTAPSPSAAQTIAWSPDASAIAYLVPRGVRFAYPGQGQYGEPQFGLVQGAWVELYWEDLDTLIASDENGTATRISGSYQNWTLEPASDMPARPQPSVLSYLTPQGVVLGNAGAVPGTAGALAFDWGPLPPEAVTGYALPADLYFIAPDANGIEQVWRLPRSGDPPQAITNDLNPVSGYGVSPDGTHLAYVAGDRLRVRDGNGGLTELAILERESGTVRPRWNPGGTQIAYHDQRGVWVVLADGTQPPRIVARSVPFNEQTGPSATRFYFDPRWSPDGTRLLVGVGLWEGAILGVADLASGTLTELNGLVTGDARWTSDGRILAWSSFYAYAEPGLFLYDPGLPDAAPVALIAGRPVWDAVPGPVGDWYTLVSEAAQMGPRFLRVWQSPGLDSGFGPVFPAQAGGFALQAQLNTDGTQFIIAGMQPQDEDQLLAGTGTLWLVDVSYNTTVRLSDPAPVRDLQWGP